jgi:hypothetical protein
MIGGNLHRSSPVNGFAIFPAGIRSPAHAV